MSNKVHLPRKTVTTEEIVVLAVIAISMVLISIGMIYRMGNY